jgi:hypothetical protein
MFNSRVKCDKSINGWLLYMNAHTAGAASGMKLRPGELECTLLLLALLPQVFTQQVKSPLFCSKISSQLSSPQQVKAPHVEQNI